ncbi:hypothetical protein ACR6C2_34130 [Streptomyces sp. INA 01156]
MRAPDVRTPVRHAVALALHAVERRLPWHATPADDARRAPGEALSALTAVEKAAVLDRLLDTRPELHAEADQLALRVLDPQTRAELTDLQKRTAVEVENALRALDVGQLSTGHRPGFGYTDVHEAASRLIEPVVERYEADVRRRLEWACPTRPRPWPSAYLTAWTPVKATTTATRCCATRARTSPRPTGTPSAN